MSRLCQVFALYKGLVAEISSSTTILVESRTYNVPEDLCLVPGEDLCVHTYQKTNVQPYGLRALRNNAPDLDLKVRHDLPCLSGTLVLCLKLGRAFA